MPQQRVAQYLQGRAQDLHSRVLSALAVRVADDPFSKVKKLIKDLVVRLMEGSESSIYPLGYFFSCLLDTVDQASLTVL